MDIRPFISLCEFTLQLDKAKAVHELVVEQSMLSAVAAKIIPKRLENFVIAFELTAAGRNEEKPVGLVVPAV